MTLAAGRDYVKGVVRWWNRQRQSREANYFRKQHVGRGCVIDKSVQVLGWQQVRIGHHTVIGESTWINVNHRDSTDPVLTIGDNCFIARRNFFTAGARLAIGDYCLTGPDCHFLGADHDFSSPFTPHSMASVTQDSVIEVGANCWFGSSVIVLKGIRVGFGCVLGAGAVITGDCPPVSVLVGSPARIIKRYDMRRKAWVAPQDYPMDGDSLLPSEAEYLADLRSRYPTIKGARAAAGKAFGDL